MNGSIHTQHSWTNTSTGSLAACEEFNPEPASPFLVTVLFTKEAPEADLMDGLSNGPLTIICGFVNLSAGGGATMARDRVTHTYSYNIRVASPLIKANANDCDWCSHGMV